jgi:multidrug resistance efflux pump
MTHAERQARYRARQSARVAELEAEVVRLRAELASRDAGGKPCPEPELPPLPSTSEGWEALRRAATEARKARRAEAKAAAAIKPTVILPETEAVAKLQRELKGARTQIANLKADVRGLIAEWERDRNARKGKTIVMSRRLARHLRAHFHPDRAHGARNRELRDDLAKEFGSFHIVQKLGD